MRVHRRFTNEEDLISRVKGLANQVLDPCGLALGLSIGIGDMGLIRNLNVARTEGGWSVTLTLRLTSPGCFYYFYFEREIRSKLKAVPQIKSLSIEWDNVLDWRPTDMNNETREKLDEYRSKLLAIKTNPQNSSKTSMDIQ